MTVTDKPIFCLLKTLLFVLKYLYCFPAADESLHI